MKIPLLLLILILSGFIGISGCTQTIPDKGTKLVFDTPSTPVTTVTTIPIPSTSNPVITKDLIVGHWYCFIYPSWGGKILNENTIMENQTWNGVTTEYQDEGEKQYFHGTWKKESTNRYSLISSITHNSHTFEYDKSKDELLDSNFRIAGTTGLYRHNKAGLI